MKKEEYTILMARGYTTIVKGFVFKADGRPVFGVHRDRVTRKYFVTDIGTGVVVYVANRKDPAMEMAKRLTKTALPQDRTKWLPGVSKVYREMLAKYPEYKQHTDTFRHKLFLGYFNERIRYKEHLVKVEKTINSAR